MLNHLSAVDVVHPAMDICGRRIPDNEFIIIRRSLPCQDRVLFNTCQMDFRPLPLQGFSETAPGSPQVQDP